MRPTRALALPVALLVALSAACSGASGASTRPVSSVTGSATTTLGGRSGDPSGRGASTPGSANSGATDGPGDIYSHDRTLSPAVAGQKPLIYVPNHGDGTVSVIDPATYKVIDTFRTGSGPQHIVPSWDLKTLYATNDEGGDSLTPIDPTSGQRKGPNIPVPDPYNMYWTPDGTSAIVVAEAQHRLDFRDPTTFALQYSIPVDCKGVDHADFSADLKTMVVTCEFAGRLGVIDLAAHKVLRYVNIGGAPQDIKLDPAGKIYYVANRSGGGVDLIDASTYAVLGFLATGPDAHGLYVSRDSTRLYVTNRGFQTGNGSVSVIDVATRTVVDNWPVPGASPDMGNVSVDGKVLWLTGRYSNKVYALDTADGRILASIPVGTEPHGLAVWPQPGRFCLGHTGILR